MLNHLAAQIFIHSTYLDLLVIFCSSVSESEYSPPLDVCLMIVHCLFSSCLLFILKWFEEKHNQIETMEQQLKKLHTACESMVTLRKGLSLKKTLN